MVEKLTLPAKENAVQSKINELIDAKADDSDVVKLAETQTITGYKTVSGATFSVSNNNQFKLLTYDTRIDRGVAPSAWTGMFPYLLIGQNGKRLSGLYCSYALDMRNQISLIAYKGTSTDATDYSIAQIDVGYDGSTRAYAKAPTPFEDTTGSTQIDTVGARNTKLANYVPNTRKVNNKALSSDITLNASDVGALPSSTVIPTVNNPTITITQGGVTKGLFTLNQASGDTIALDAGGGGGSYTAGDGIDITNDVISVDGTQTSEVTLATVATTGAFSDLSGTSGVQMTSNLVTSVSSLSTDTQYPSAKLFYDTCGDIETLINAL